MNPQEARGLGYGKPGSTESIANGVPSTSASRATSESTRTPRSAPIIKNVDQTSGHVPTEPAGSARGIRFESSNPPSPARPPSGEGDGRRPISPPSATEMPSSSQDALAVDMEPGFSSWADVVDGKPTPWFPWTCFGSRLEHKIRDPGAASSIRYSVRPKLPLLVCFLYFAGFFAYCLLISTFLRTLQNLGFDCTPTTTTLPRNGRNSTVAIVWAETLVVTGVCFLLAQGYYGVRASRERMERVRQNTMTLAYSFLKSLRPSNNALQLQLEIYECLALLTAYPVALLAQIRGNTCEPAVTRYCRDISHALMRLRRGDDPVLSAPFERSEAWESRGFREFAAVEYFFEIFSMQLQLEFRRRSMRMNVPPSLTTQHVIYNLRNHFENLVDKGKVDQATASMMRDTIDMLSLAGRECTIFSHGDIAPMAFLWSVRLAGWLVALYNPVQSCQMLVNRTLAEDDSTTRLPLLNLSILFFMVVLAILSTTLTIIIREMWCMWDPFSKATNPYAWTLGIANEIDNMLNEFYEYDDSAHCRDWVAR
ncbi:hypothetical protein RJ55_04648 [Drechmeria coniospora]|nr:hypothetical protein RJ55_04648 [Drechmeria coniospora]